MQGVRRIGILCVMMVAIWSGSAMAKDDMHTIIPSGYVALFPYNEMDVATKGVPVSQLSAEKAENLLGYVKDRSDNHRFLLWRNFQRFFRGVSLRVVKMEWGSKINYENYITAAGLYTVKERAEEICKKMLSMSVYCMVSHVPDAMGAGKISWE